MEEIRETLRVAQGISDFGVMVVICAAFVVLSVGLMVACFRWFKGSITDLIEAARELRQLNESLAETNRIMRPIAERFAPETQMRVKVLAGALFDLAVERVCRMVVRIRVENHIADRRATRAKIERLLHNLHDDRNSRLDNFWYRGKPLSRYCNAAWAEWVAQVVEREVYHQGGANDSRTYTNVKTTYENIKLDFYHRINQ